MYRIGRTSPDAVTVCFNSGRVSSLTVTTSGSSLRVATTLTTTAIASTAATIAPITIFFFRLNAILINSFETGALNSEVASTWKLIKQFHLRANCSEAILQTINHEIYYQL